jgi:hemoglobin-like flavoprotein
VHDWSIWFLADSLQLFSFTSFFSLEPNARTVFAFGKDTDLTDEFFKTDGLIQHAKFYMKMVDRAINLIGPDIDLLTEILLELGEKHDKFGVKPSYYPPMGQALIITMADMLGDKFTPEIKDAWIETYQALAYVMIRARSHPS